MNSLRKSLRRKYREPNLSIDEFQEGVQTFQHKCKKRESMRMRKQAANVLPKDIEAAIEKEVNVINASTKLLEACHNPIQRLEVAKTLILSKARLNCLKLTPPAQPKNGGAAAVKPLQHLGNVYLTGLRVPLAWNINDLINPPTLLKGTFSAAKPQYAMFAVVTCSNGGPATAAAGGGNGGGIAFDTELITAVDSELSEVTFNETLTFANVTPDFRLDVSLYCCRQSPAGGTITLAKLTRSDRTLGRIKSLLMMRSINNNINKSAVLHNSSHHQSQENEFQCIAKARLGLKDIQTDGSSSHVWCLQQQDLAGSTSGSGAEDSQQPPLYDYFSFRMWAKPGYKTESAACTATKVAVSWPNSSDIVVSNCHVRLQPNMRVALWMSESMVARGAAPWKEIMLTDRTRLCATSDSDDDYEEESGNSSCSTVSGLAAAATASEAAATIITLTEERYEKGGSDNDSDYDDVEYGGGESPAEVQLVSLAFKTPADCARMLAAMRAQLASYIAWNEYERIADRNEILSPLSGGGGDNVLYRDSPPKYRRQFEKRTHSKLILLYNQVSGINLLNGYQPKL